MSRTGRADRIAVVDAAAARWTAGGQVTRTMARSLVAAGATKDRSVVFVSASAQPGDEELSIGGIDVVNLGGALDDSAGGRGRWGSSQSAFERKVRRALSLPDGADPLAYLRGTKLDAVLPMLSVPPRPRLPGTVGWITDFQHRAMPEFFSPQECATRERSYARLVRRSAVVLLSSQAMAADFARYYPSHSHKARVLPFPSPLAFSTVGRDATSAPLTYNLPARYALVANQFWQHKNHELVVEAVARAKGAGVEIPVVMTGLPSDYRDSANRTVSRVLQRIAKAGLGGQVIVLGQVPYEDLVELMNCAEVIIQPSRYEGWSTSVEDAKALGIPLLCSDIPVHREQAMSFGSRFFKTDDADSMAEVLAALWGSARRPTTNATERALAGARDRAELYGCGLVEACDAAAGR